jgi:Cyclic nucleotide-binding domain
MDDTGIPFVGADLPGHASYVLIAVSYWLTNITWLRVTAVVGLALEIVYFSLSGGAMHAGIAWDVVFILINLYQIYRLVAERRAVAVDAEAQRLGQGALAGLDWLQIARLIKAGSWRDFESGARLTEEGRPVAELVLICDGHAAVEAGGRRLARLHDGAFVGEMAFVSGNPASATVTAEDRIRALVFDMAKLRDLVRGDEIVAAALHRVIGRDLARKLARHDDQPPRAA